MKKYSRINGGSVVDLTNNSIGIEWGVRKFCKNMNCAMNVHLWTFLL